MSFIEYEDIVHTMYDFLSLGDLHKNVRCTNKVFNNHAKKFIHNHIRVDKESFEALCKCNEIINVKTIEFIEIDFNSFYFISSIFNIKEKITLFDCKIPNKLPLPKKIHNIDLISSYNNFTKFIKSFTTMNLKKLSIHYEHDNNNDNTNIENIFSLKLEELSLVLVRENGFNFMLTSNHLKILSTINGANLRSLEILCFDFDKSLNSLKYFQELKLTKLDLSGCNIDDDDVKNIMTPSILDLSLRGTNISDVFIKKLSLMKHENKLNLTDLDVTGTSITTKCIKYLNILDLNKLIISDCARIENLNELCMPSLTDLSIIFNNQFKDDDIKNIFCNKSIETLDMSYIEGITNLTLERILKSNIRLKTLYFKYTSSTKEDINNFLANMKLSKKHILLVT